MSRASCARALAPLFLAATCLLVPLTTRAALYAPGATLDPACAPTDSGCGIQTPVSSGTTGQVPYYAASGTGLTATSSLQILPNGTASTSNLVVSSTFTLGTISGFLKAVGGNVQTAFVNLTSDVTGILPVVNGGTGTSTPSGLLKGDGAGLLQTAVAGIDYQPAGNYVSQITCTGSADDVAINAAITAASAAGGGTVRIGPTTSIPCDITSSVLMKSNVWLRGSGPGVTVLQLHASRTYNNSANVVSSIASSGNISNWEISDLSINGNRSNQSLAGSQDNAWNGIVVRGSGNSDHYTSTDFVIDNVEIYGAGFHGIAVYDGAGNFRISGGYFHGNGFRGIHVHADDADATSEFEITNNRISANGVDTTTGQQSSPTPGFYSGLFVALDNGLQGSVIGNTIWNEPGVGLEVEGYVSPSTVQAEHVTFTGNTIYNVGMGIKIGGEAKNIVISGNTIKGANTSGKASGSGGSGILFASADSVVGASGMTISNNVITDCSGWGIAATTASNKWRNISFTGNIIKDNGTDTTATTGGVFLTSFNASTFIGNTIYGNNAGSAAPRQFYVTNSTNLTVTGNSIDSGTANYPAAEIQSSASNVLFSNNYVNRNSGSGTAVTFTAANSVAFENTLAGSNTFNNNGTNNSVGLVSSTGGLNLTGTTTVATAFGGFGIGTTTLADMTAVQNNSSSKAIASFYTSLGTTALRILNSGSVVIGTTTPYSTLEVWSPSSSGTTTAFSVVNNASTTVFAAYANGNATYSGSIFNSSDQRLKTDIAPLDASSSLSAILALSPVSYTRLDQPGTGTNLGFLAQSVQAIFPSLVSTTSPTALTPGGTLTLNYVGLIAPIVKSIQALAGEVGGFAQQVTTVVLNATEGHFSSRLCVGSTCVTPDQFAAMVAASQSNQSGSGEGGAPSSIVITDAISDASSTPADDSTNTAAQDTTASSTPATSDIQVNGADAGDVSPGTDSVSSADADSANPDQAP